MNFRDPFNLLHTKKSFIGQAPGTITYTGQFTDVEVTIEGIIYNEKEIKKIETKTIQDSFEKDKIYWFNVIGLHDDNIIKKIGEKLLIHHMDLEDIMHVSQWSKIEKKDHYLFSIFKMIYLKNSDIIHEHISIIHKDNVIITFQETPGDVFDNVRERLLKCQGKIRTMGSEYLYYSLLDVLIDQYFVIINRISILFKETEMKILENKQEDLDQVYHLRKELLYLINAISPIKDSINILSSNKNDYITQSMAPYYSDLMEHLNQISDSLKAYKEMTNSLYEMQMSNISNNMNKAMMILAIFSSIFIPLSFLAGVFGMNFTYIPGINMPSAFYYFLLSCLAIIIGMLSFFKIKKWF